MKSLLIRCSLPALIMSCAVVPTEAQQAPPESTEARDTVVVTARKREEVLQDVPAAVSAITSDEIENLVLDGAQDYIRQVPSATLVTSGPEYLNDFSLRGQGGGRLGFSETTTGIYKDGNYVAGGGFGGRSLNRLDLFDIERIEVLRGPQGALYGRNAVGGAINVIAKGPAEDVEFGAKVGFQDTDRLTTELILNPPKLGDVLGLRVAAFLDDQDEGHTRSLTSGRFVDAQEFAGARATAELTPFDWTRLQLTYEYYDSKTPGFGNLGYRAVAPANVGGFAIDPDPYTRAFLSREGFTEVTEDSVFLTGEFQTGLGDLTIRLNQRQRDGVRSGEDGDHFAGIPNFTINGVVNDFFSAQSEDFSRTGVDIMLASTGGDGFDWLVGIEGQFVEDTVGQGDPPCANYSATGAPTFLAGCVPGGAVAALPDFSSNGSILTAAQATAALGTGRNNLNNDSFRELLQSYSLYGALDFDLTDSLAFGLEARVQQDRKKFEFQRFSEDPLVYFGAGAAPAGRLPEIVVNGQPAQFCPPSISGTSACVADGGISRDTLVYNLKRDWTEFTPAATLTWQASEDSTFYARIATAYRPGGFNSQTPAGLPRADVIALASYDPETVTSGELGWKGRVLDLFSLEANIFIARTEDALVVTAPSAASRGFVLQNSGETQIYGFELEGRGRYQIGPGQLLLNLALSSTDGEFREGSTALLDINGDAVPDVVDLAGNQAPRLRDYQLSLTAAYTFPIDGGGLRGLISAGVQSADGGFENPDNSRQYTGYTLFDARFGIQSDGWRLTAFGRNLSDERYRLQEVAGNEFWNEPRLYGVELSFSY